jgi:hypothetical protein
MLSVGSALSTPSSRVRISWFAPFAIAWILSVCCLILCVTFSWSPRISVSLLGGLRAVTLVGEFFPSTFVVITVGLDSFPSGLYSMSDRGRAFLISSATVTLIIYFSYVISVQIAFSSSFPVFIMVKSNLHSLHIHRSEQLGFLSVAKSPALTPEQSLWYHLSQLPSHPTAAFVFSYRFPAVSAGSLVVFP